MITTLKNFYRQRFRGKLFVIKVGGALIMDDTARRYVLENIKDLTCDGIKVLLIYGGGKAIDAALKKSKLSVQKIDGRRITGAKEIAIIKHVLSGDLGHYINETMTDLGLAGIVLNALPPTFTKLKRRPKKNGIMRFDGTIEEIETTPFKKLFQASNFVAAPCLGTLKNNITVNINADNAAVSLACQLKAAKLIFLSDVDGILIDGKLASVLQRSELHELIDNGTITDGMRVKAENCIEALSSGVKRAHILNGFQKNVLLKEVYTSKGAGTMLIRRRQRKLYELEELKKES